MVLELIETDGEAEEDGKKEEAVKAAEAMVILYDVCKRPWRETPMQSVTSSPLNQQSQCWY